MCFGVVFDSIDRDVKLTVDDWTLTVIKRDDVGVIVVLQVVLVDGQEVGIRAEDNGDVSNRFLMVVHHTNQPTFNQASLRTTIGVVRIVK